MTPRAADGVDGESWEARMSRRAHERGAAMRQDFGPAPPLPDDVCAECVEYQLDPNHGWRMFLKCNHMSGSGLDRCQHECHKDEVWIG